MLPLRLLPVAMWLGIASWCLAVQIQVARASDERPLAESALQAQARVLKAANDSVVGLRATAVEDAASARTLGRRREGSGVVIGADGLVLTIGYLILEAESVELLLDADRVVPARVVGYDVATGFGLVQALVPLRLPVAPLAAAAGLTNEEPLMISSGGEDGDVSVAHLLSRRAYSGFWEYHIDSALFTAPPRSDHSGAGLFNGRGELVGIGSLLVTDALGRKHPNVQGNMFVPVDLLLPILDEMRQHGASKSSRRAWLGLNCTEHEGQVRVLRVNTDSPAELAGVLPGDRIVRIDGAEVSDLEALWKTLWRGDRSEREVTLDITRGAVAQTLKVHAVDRAMTLRRAKGI